MGLSEALIASDGGLNMAALVDTGDAGEGRIGMKLSRADATHLPFPDNDFDIVLSFGVMHHISNWLDALEEIDRVLKPKGYFVHADIVCSRLVAKLAKSFKHNYGVPTTRDLNLFIEHNKFSTIRASLSKSLIWNWCEAVYQRK